MIYQGWCMVGVVVMTTGSRQMRPVAPPVRLQTVILTVIATQTVRRSSAQSHVFEHPTGYRLGEADCCVRILWAGDMSDDMEDEAVSAQHRARLVLAARALLGESRGHNRKPKGFTWGRQVRAHRQNVRQSPPPPPTRPGDGGDARSDRRYVMRWMGAHLIEGGAAPREGPQERGPKRGRRC